MSRCFAIFLTKKGTRLVNKDIDVEIMDVLDSGNFTIGEISEMVGRSRSTVAGRLVRLKSLGIADTITDSDLRKNVYSMSSIRLMHSRKPSSDSKARFLSSVSRIADGTTGLYDGMLESLFYGAAVGGLDNCQIFMRIAHHIGERIAEECDKGDFFRLSECLNDLFGSNGIGSFRMTVTYFVNIEFTMSDGYDRNNFKVMESIYRGIIRSALEKNSGKSMEMVDRGTTDNGFVFELHFKGRDVVSVASEVQ